MQLNNIKGITNTYIFYIDDTHETTKIEYLKSIYQDICNNVIFYDRMLKESGEILRQKIDVLDKIKCPSNEEIKNTRDILVKIDLECKQENYIKKQYDTFGINNITKYALDKKEHYSKLKKQIELIIKL